MEEEKNLSIREEEEGEGIVEEEQETQDVVEVIVAKKKKRKANKGGSCNKSSTVEGDQSEIKSMDRKEKKISKHVRAIQQALARRNEAEERKNKEEEERLKKEEEALRLEEEHDRQVEEARRKKKEKEKEKLERKRGQGKPITQKQKEQARRLESMRNQILSRKFATPSEPAKESEVITIEIGIGSSSSMKEEHQQESDGSGNHLRSPICCIMGHVDTGKTKLLDCIRGTNVQEGEAGGITQQIGATYIPAKNISERTKNLKANANLGVPGLLVIDTPGHESFINLRSRGSGLCDIAILVVDIMHGLEPQGKESLDLLKMRNTHFIVALNKVDRLYGWKTCSDAPILNAMKQQTKNVRDEFERKLQDIVWQFKKEGLNTELYYKNKEMAAGTISIVPTSAISGEGIPDLLLLLAKWTQKTMVEKLMFREEVQCTILEVKVTEGFGTTIDVIVVNGTLRKGDQIIVCGMHGPIVTTIRALLTPPPMKEIRVKGSYEPHEVIKAAQGIKIAAQGLEHCIPGSSLIVVRPGDNLEDAKEAVMQDMSSVMSRIDKTGVGVCVQASTLGSLEALLEFLKSPAVNIPVSRIRIGPVHKKDVTMASIMLDKKKKQYATILAFDVKVTPEARELADEKGVKIFTADIIYHLFDQFKVYIDSFKEEKKKEAGDEVVYPCVVKIMPGHVYNQQNPIILGVYVLAGTVKVGTPICIPSKGYISIGRVASIHLNKKPIDFAIKGQEVSISIESTNPDEQQKQYGRHFDKDDELVSDITKLNPEYREYLTEKEWRLVLKLQNLFKTYKAPKVSKF